MKKETIAIDMDGVMADVETHFLSWFNKEYQDTLTHQDLKGKSESKAFPVKGIIKGETLLFEAFHNIKVKNHSRAKNWNDVLHYFDMKSDEPD